MKNEEAKDRIKTLMAASIDASTVFEKRPIVYAFDLAIKALEKRIPEKPQFEGDGYADGEMVYDVWICPCCGERYETDYEQHDYCPVCGQAIDWSEED